MTSYTLDQLMTPEIRSRLAAIGGRHAAKKRSTVVRLAYARLTGQNMKTVFTDFAGTCSETIWYTKWQYQPAIRAAYDALCRQADELLDQQSMTEIERIINQALGQKEQKK